MVLGRWLAGPTEQAAPGAPTKENRGIRRFMRRGLSAAESEWALICATGNVLKLFRHAHGRSRADTITPAT